MSDSISRADVFEIIDKAFSQPMRNGVTLYADICLMLNTLPTHANSRSTHERDLISRANAIRWVKTECNPYGKPTLDYDSGLKVIEHLKKMPSELPSTEAEWIPCSERLPDAEYGEGDSMLCCTESGLMYILYWNGGNWCASTGEPYHWVNHKTRWHDKVIAWMPLPKPYREESEVGE